MTADKQSQNRIQRIEELVQKIESVADPELRAGALELVQALMELHGEGLNRMLEVISEDPSGQAVINKLGQDEMVGGLLILYGLHPLDLETRVNSALEKVRPYLRSHGGNVALTSIAEGVVRLQLEGSCNGCASSAMTMKLAIEEAIFEFAPDVVELVVDGVVEEKKPQKLVPLQITRPERHWTEVAGVTALSQGATVAIDVDGRQILFCRLNGDYYAYQPNCSSCGQTLVGARLEASSLSCLKCGEQFDISRAGRSLGRADLQLQPFPLLLENGQAKIALPLQQ
jgi:Fe-S cluster biogenesis protein NfuA/nitrite reductase/ring-hydroxylating ferredoxin subunit